VEPASWSDVHDKLVTHFGFPVEQCQHVRTTNPIESTFATVKLRYQGAGSRAAGLAMAFRLLLAAERTRRRLNGHELLSLVCRRRLPRRSARRPPRLHRQQPNVKKGRTRKNVSVR
jgi:hypothetical protein